MSERRSRDSDERTSDFTLNKPYTAKGNAVEGVQHVVYRDGGILWQDNIYSELRFKPTQQDASFTLEDVTIGVDFHWERKEAQTFHGTLHLLVDEGKIVVINEVDAEEYLKSVISSEMRSTSSMELLKAHAVVSAVGSSIRCKRVEATRKMPAVSSPLHAKKANICVGMTAQITPCSMFAPMIIANAIKA